MASPANVFKMPVVGGRVGKLPSFNEILPRLYLGDIFMAVNKDEISRLGITDMISVEIKPLQASDLAPTIKRYLYINVMDHLKQDILSHFDTSNDFIETALKVPSNKVYVHCVAGISRSATLVIAYIMKTRSMNFMEAFDLVKQKRKIIDPNEGFVRQLTLYHKMKYTIDIGNLEYRRIVLDALVFEFRLIALAYYQTQSSKTSIFPGLNSFSSSPSSSSGNSSSQSQSTSSNLSSSGNISNSTSIVHVPIHHKHNNLANKNNIGVLFDQYYNKLNLQQVSKYPTIYDPSTAYRCNKCRVIVFYAICVIENKTSNQQQQQQQQPAPTSSGVSSLGKILDFKSINKHQSQSEGKECPFIFIEPQPWMSKSILEREGNLECYKCKRKLGKFNWTSEESCSCPRHNSHMNFNLFKIMRKKVDYGGGPSF